MIGHGRHGWHGIRVRKRTDCSEMNRLFDNGQYFFMEMSWNQ